MATKSPSRRVPAEVRRAGVTMMGPFPPPLGGSAKITELIFESLSAANVDVTKIDLSANNLSHRRNIAYHLQRLTRNVSGLLRSRQRAERGSTLYIVPDGGDGAWYTLAHVRAAGGGYGKSVLHHHSCRYVETHSRPVDMLTRSYHEKATHVFLTAGMAEDFQRRYRPVTHLIASNARFVADEAGLDASPRLEGPVRLGHLGNLCRDKGFFAVADAYDALRECAVDAVLRLAGPVLEPEVQARLDQLRSAHGQLVQHAGPVSGSAKRDFYRSIDCFLFPTQFSQEAAPVVIYEALAAGVPVLSTDRGRIPEIVWGERGAVCPRDGSFTKLIVDYLRDSDWSVAAHGNRATSIKASVRTEGERARADFAQLMKLLGADAGADLGSAW